MKLSKISLTDKTGGGYVQDVEALESKALPKRITRRYVLLGSCFLLLLVVLAIRSLALENERFFSFKLPFDAIPVISSDSSPSALTLQTGEAVSSSVANIKNLTATSTSTRPAQVAAAIKSLKESAKHTPVKNQSTKAVPSSKPNNSTLPVPVVAKKAFLRKGDLRSRI